MLKGRPGDEKEWKIRETTEHPTEVGYPGYPERVWYPGLTRASLISAPAAHRPELSS